ncbi:MAG: hypothetical protein ACOVN3_10275, partial [Limnohabitans sp.]
ILCRKLSLKEPSSNTDVARWIAACLVIVLSKTSKNTRLPQNQQFASTALYKHSRTEAKLVALQS